MNLKTALMALAMGTLVFGNVGCGNACDDLESAFEGLNCPAVPEGGGGAGGGTAETVECNETQAECLTACVEALDDCDGLATPEYGECAGKCL